MAWRSWLAQFQDPLIHSLLVAVLVMLLVWLLEGGRGLPLDALVILVIVLLNALIGFLQQARSLRAAAALARLSAVSSAVVRDVIRQRIPSAELGRGDLLLSEGEQVGADARLLQASALRVQEASLTGESNPVTKASAPLPVGSRWRSAATWCSGARLWSRPPAWRPGWAASRTCSPPRP